MFEKLVVSKKNIAKVMKGLEKFKLKSMYLQIGNTVASEEGFNLTNIMNIDNIPTIVIITDMVNCNDKIMLKYDVIEGYSIGISFNINTGTILYLTDSGFCSNGAVGTAFTLIKSKNIVKEKCKMVPERYKYLLTEAEAAVDKLKPETVFKVDQLFKIEKWVAIPTHLRVKLGMDFSSVMKKRYDVELIPKIKTGRRFYKKLQLVEESSENDICKCDITREPKLIFAQDSIDLCSECLKNIDTKDGSIYTIDQNKCNHNTGNDTWASTYNGTILNYTYCSLCGMTHLDYIRSKNR